jgi:pre-mRNA-processing factor 39
MRYIRWLEGHNPDTAPAALQRATLLFCKRKAEMLLFAARYEERHGQLDAAQASYSRLLSEVAPGLLQVRCWVGLGEGSLA